MARVGYEPLGSLDDAKITREPPEKVHDMCDRVDQLPLFSYGRDGHQAYSRALYTHV